jgi:hypothetical protein
MTWHAIQGGYNQHPYQVRWVSGGKWLARFNHGRGMPEHLGTFATANEAKAACEGHRMGKAEEWQECGWGDK